MGLCAGGLCQGDPPYSCVRAVRILLECILVCHAFDCTHYTGSVDGTGNWLHTHFPILGPGPAPSPRQCVKVILKIID